MIIKTLALFTAPQDSTDPDDLLSEINGEVVTQKEFDEDGIPKLTHLYPTQFVFDMKDVISINVSAHCGYSTIRYVNDSYSIRMSFEKLERLFKLCKG